MKYTIEIVYTDEDIQTGMRKYRYPPSNGMLFILRGMYTSVTMKGMRFPLRVAFLNKDGNYVSEWITLYPESKDISIPSSAYYMLEFPLHLLK